MNIGIIIQARLGSTRLPNKILLDFHNGKCILEILCERLTVNTKYNVIIATTTNTQDDVLVDFCKKRNIAYYRGSETDVLTRFIKTAERYQLTHIIRICSDNPFIYPADIEKLGETLPHYPDSDYISFKIKEKPSILTHYGFWAELVSLNALYQAAKSNDSNAREHVTNYIYTNAEQFAVKWLSVSTFIEENDGIRLTVDTHDDFTNAQFIYRISGEQFNPQSIIEIINNSDIKQNMLIQIKKNQKQ